jgi:tetratricopeptide (TPR) repeat protein
MELTGDQRLQQAVAAHNVGDLQEAERLYRSILQVQPNHPDVNHNLGLIAVSANQPRMALPLFKSAIDANPNVEQFWLSYIEALITTRQFIDAKQALKKGKKKGVGKENMKILTKKLASVKAGNILIPAPPQAELQKLIDHYQNGRYEDAEKLAFSIAKQFPEHPSSYNVLGGVYRQSGRLSELVIVSEKVVALSPKDAEAHSNLGLALKELGRLEESKLSYKRALKLKPDFVEIHKDLGNVLSELGKLSEAQESYEQALAFKSDDAEVHYNLGIILSQLSRLEEAEASYGQAILLKPDYTGAHNNLGITLQALGKLEKAQACYRQAIALKPNFAGAHLNLGNAQHGLGNLEEAKASYEQAIVLEPDFAEAHCNLGITLKELGRIVEAELSLRQAIELNPIDFPDAFDLLGFILQRRGEFEDAEACYRKFISLRPNKIPNTSSKGAILFREGDFEGALSVFESYGNAMSRARALECLYALGRIGDIYERIEAQVDLDNENLRVAAISAFLTERENQSTAHNFCNNPLDFVHFANISSHIEDHHLFITDVIDELRNVKSIWEPVSRTTRNGFQATSNVFEYPSQKMSLLKAIIIDELDAYFLKFKNKSCSFIQKWPLEKDVSGWHVILKQQGHQTAHIHPNGWLSGVIYLAVVPSLGRDEGAIELSLNGPNYFDVESSKKIHQPILGDMVFFPSSLHHRTLPFSTDMNRICVSFDLKPDSTKR